jgi:fructosamine-3-kinase
VSAAAVPPLPVTVAAWCERERGGQPVAIGPLAGGIISTTRRLRFAAGISVVVKQQPGAPADFFDCEAEGLAALRLPGDAWRVPEVLHAAHDGLVLEDLGDGAERGDGYWEVLGRSWARLHGRRVTRCGWRRDNYYGTIRQDNRWNGDAFDFYARTRFLPWLQRPGCAATLSAVDRRQLERIALRLRELVPPQGPALLHGDLWCGNLLVADDGRPAVVDPSVHYGWPEADLHNAAMFGGFDERFFAAYLECHPLEPGWRQRLELFYLPHLLGMVEHRCDLDETVPWLRRLLARFA